MTYCLGIVTKYGLVMASDSRTNAGYDQVNTTRKMHTFVTPGDRVFVLLSSGSLSCTQSIVTLLRREFDRGEGLAKAGNMYDAARVVGEQVRKVAELDRTALEKDDLRFNVHFLLGGQVKGEGPALFLIYPQGNPLQASEESPYLQVGETKYGRPILDRGIRFNHTSLEEAAKYALLSLDSTMKSNVTVGPPVDLLAYEANAMDITHQRHFGQDDPDLNKIRIRWQQALRQAVSRLPNIRFSERHTKTATADADESIELVEPGTATPEPTEVPAQQGTRGKS
jgi:putative proteasome-type protease